MPTPQSAATFAKLLAARTRLNQITVRLQEHLSRGESLTPAYRALQYAWDDALAELDTASEEYSKAVKDFHDQVTAVLEGREAS